MSSQPADSGPVTAFMAQLESVLGLPGLGFDVAGRMTLVFGEALAVTFSLRSGQPGALHLLAHLGTPVDGASWWPKLLQANLALGASGAGLCLAGDGRSVAMQQLLPLNEAEPAAGVAALEAFVGHAERWRTSLAAPVEGLPAGDTLADARALALMQRA